MKYKFKTEPYPHQVRALKKVVRNKRGALFMPMRSGKTKTAIDWCGALNTKYRDFNKVLIVCPLSVVGVWRRQFKLHCAVPYYFNDSDEVVTESEVLVVECINFEQLYGREKTEGRSWAAVDQAWLKDYKPDAIIVDESHKIGDPTTVSSRKLWKLARECNVKYRLILTGTAVHRKPFYLFGQFKFLDESVFGTSWGPFKQMYGLFQNNAQYPVLLKYRNMKHLRRKVEPYAFTMAHVPLRPPVHDVRPVELGAEAISAYTRLSRESILELEGGTLTADIVIVRLLKLAQIAGGNLRVDDTWHKIGDHQQRAFSELCEEFESSDVGKFVTSCRFLPEIKDAARTAVDNGFRPILLHGGLTANERETRIADFDDADDRCVFISQVSAGALGIDLSAASVLVHYSLDHSLINFDQMNARIRKYKDKRALTYYYLLGRGTVHETMYVALQEKMNMVKQIMEHPELLSYREVG